MLFCMPCHVWAQAGAKPPTPNALPAATHKLLGQIRSMYAQKGDLKASFVQIYQDAMTEQQRVESGSVWVKRDGRLRFTYLQPERKDFIFDGNRAYFYEPENAQVTVFDHFADSPAIEAMHWLFGQGHLGGMFAIKPCCQSQAETVRCPKLAPDQTQICLFPSTPQPSVEQVVLQVMRTSHQIAQATLFDALNNQTTYRFDDVVFGHTIPASTFDFTIPPGVSLLQAPTGETSAAAL